MILIEKGSFYIMNKLLKLQEKRDILYNEKYIRYKELIKC